MPEMLLPPLLKEGWNPSSPRTQVKDQSIYASTVVGEYGTSAQSAKSTQAVNKLETKQNTEIANILAGNAFQLNAVNESMVRNTSALGNIVTTQSILVDKQTVSQYLDAAQLRQQGQIFTTLNNQHEYEKLTDMYQHLAAADTSSLLHFPGLLEPQPTTTASKRNRRITLALIFGILIVLHMATHAHADFAEDLISDLEPSIAHDAFWDELWQADL